MYWSWWQAQTHNLGQSVQCSNIISNFSAWLRLKAKIGLHTTNSFQLSLWHLSRQHLSWLHLSISAISQLFLTRFCPNFKGRFLKQSLSEANCQGNILPGNILYVLAKFVHFSNVSCYYNQISTKQNFGPTILPSSVPVGSQIELK